MLQSGSKLWAVASRSLALYVRKNSSPLAALIISPHGDCARVSRELRLLVRISFQAFIYDALSQAIIEWTLLVLDRHVPTVLR